MVLFILLYKVVLTFESVDESVTIQKKATEQYFTMVLHVSSVFLTKIFYTT